MNPERSKADCSLCSGKRKKDETPQSIWSSLLREDAGGHQGVWNQANQTRLFKRPSSLICIRMKCKQMISGFPSGTVWWNSKGRGG